MTLFRFQPAAFQTFLQTPEGQRHELEKSHVIETDVVIAGSGPVACTYARTILEEHPTARVTMVEIGAQDGPIPGGHQKNSIKYQKDIDAFVNVIKGALQSVSVPPEDSYLPTLGGDAWTTDKKQVFHGSNPNQVPSKNLKSAGITRTVGGMATHWTCNCPTPNDEEIVENPIPKAERDELFKEAAKLLNIHSNAYDNSIRHTIVKETLEKGLHSRLSTIINMPLAVERRQDNPDYVTWSGSNTVLGDTKQYGDRFQLLTESRVTTLIRPTVEGIPVGREIRAVQVRNLHDNEDYFILADAFVVACGAIGTPQILYNSEIRPAPLGRYLCEQSIAFSQIVLRRSLIDSIPNRPEWKKRVEEHRKAFPNDPLPIPYNDPEPQVQISFSGKFPWHCQVHRDAFSYGDVGPRADSRLIVDLRFFGRQEVSEDNRVKFGPDDERNLGDWVPGVTDIYGMPQPTFEVRRSVKDQENDQKMMKDMCDVANLLGAYLPGSDPQFMEPGLALHITGTTRIGKNSETSVANAESRVWNVKNLWVGGNGCIPDSTASNPTKTSVMIAIKGARALIHYLEKQKED